MKEIITKILKRWADSDVNLQSEAAREVLAKELTYELLKELGKELQYNNSMPMDKAQQIKFAKRKHRKQLKRDAKNKILRIVREKVKIHERRFGPIDEGTLI